MGPVAAFRELGYELPNPYAWSVKCDKGVCLALWGGEISWSGHDSMFDTRVHAGKTDWRSDPKAEMRLAHLRDTWSKWNGRVDLVVREGTPNANNGTAQAWKPIGKRAGTYWRLREEPDYENREFAICLFRPSEVNQ
jgi:hypothetical protein